MIYCFKTELWLNLGSKRMEKADVTMSEWQQKKKKKNSGAEFYYIRSGVGSNKLTGT